MPMTYTITAEEAKAVEKERKGEKNKQADKRMRAVQLRGEGMRNGEIAIILETSSDVVSRWVSSYAKSGIEALQPKPHPGRPTQMSYEDEEKMLAQFAEKAKAGQVVEVSEIKAVYEQLVGHKISSGQIYCVLKRHKWRKVKPRSRHPKKASPEAIEASKKLTPAWKN